MKYALTNHSTDVSSLDAQAIALGVSFWLQDAFCPAHDLAPMQLVFYEDQALVPPDAELYDLQNEAPNGVNADAYHTEDASGRIISPVFVSNILGRGGSLYTPGTESASEALGHEVAEARLNPFVNRWRDIGDGMTEQADEVGDPVQATGDARDVGDKKVSVPNVVLPSYFDPYGKLPYDLHGVLTQPFSHVKTGYMMRRDRVSGKVSYVFGDEVPDAKKEHILFHGRHRRRHPHLAITPFSIRVGLDAGVGAELHEWLNPNDGCHDCGHTRGWHATKCHVRSCACTAFGVQ